MVTDLASAYDGCSGISYPPYDYGNVNGVWSNSVWAFEPTITGSSRIGIRNFGSSLPGTQTYTANTGGAPEIPLWYIESGPASQITLLPSIHTATAIPTASAIPMSCNNPAGFSVINYRVGNLTAGGLGVIVVGIQQTFVNQTNAAEDFSNSDIVTEASSDGTEIPNVVRPPHATYLGYLSSLNWTVTDTCGVVVPNLQMHEEFPNGFQYEYVTATGWVFPTPDQ